jgi:hypothetical protein
MLAVAAAALKVGSGAGLRGDGVDDAGGALAGLRPAVALEGDGAALHQRGRLVKLRGAVGVDLDRAGGDAGEDLRRDVVERLQASHAAG